MMIKKMLKIFRQNEAIQNKPKNSYSQFGEDIIIRVLFDNLKIPNPSYIDIGAYHPYIFSNTAHFYEKGSSGINIEPNPKLLDEFIKERKRDINLNLGIAEKNGELNYYIMSDSTLNTFSEYEAKRLVDEEGQNIEKILTIPVINLNYLLENYLSNIWPDFLSLDAEGLEDLIVCNLGKYNNKPKVICIETISYNTHGIGEKNRSLIRYLEDIGYLLFADTYVNSIFVLKDLWLNRKRMKDSEEKM